ncbi:Peptidyl-prolyl cis-trans isomerase CYP19-2 [Diplonema papillatum]|nr:Peptidyl-prolyl cis-trans isomerase CYP19-2 [Diplonema papillatum]
MSRAFVEVTVGDEAANQKAQDEWKQVREFVEKKGAEYGLSTADAAELTEEDRGVLADILAADPSFSESSKRTDCPPDPVLGTLVIELYEAKCPKTCANFKALCTGEKGKGKASGKPLHYLNSVFHRMVPGTLVQGGDFVKGTGAAGESIYGLKFKDEKEGLAIKHTGFGDVGMANGGKDSNSSQFYIALAKEPLSKLDGKHVVFGKVVEGLETLEKMAKFAGEKDGTPAQPLKITKCGVQK